MTTALDETPPSVDPTDGEDRPSRRVTVGMVAAVVVSLGIVLFWIVVYTTASSYKPPGYLADRTFPKAAEKVCASFTPRLEAIPLAQTAKTSTERADLVDEVTVILSERRQALYAVVPNTDDARFINAWLKDWSKHLADRQSYADQLRVRPDAEYRETTKGTSQISKVLNKFSDDNEMSSCSTSHDVG